MPSLPWRLFTSMRVEIMEIEDALQQYARTHDGKYPDTLAPLIEPDQLGNSYWNGSQVPRDPWNRVYLYTPPGFTDEKPIVTTLGRDGLAGGDGQDQDFSSISIADERLSRANPR